MSYDNVIETFEHDGCTVRIAAETEPGIGDPRDADNPSLLYCWHPNYILGDEQFTRNDYEAIEDAETYLREQRGAVGPILPLYLLDHSGLSLSVGSPSAADPGGWDTTHVGYICAPDERLTVCCGDGDEYRTDEWITGMLRTEVECYSAYLQGSVVYYTVEHDGDTVGGCGGFLIVREADMDEVRAEARAEAEAFASDRRETQRLWAFGNVTA